MPLTALDPISALIVIDLQKGAIDHPLIRPVSEIICLLKKRSITA
jgi:hypothetical protein